MPASYISSTVAKSDSAATTIAALAINAIVGNSLIVCISSYTGTKRTVSSIADTAGNTYTKCGSSYSGDASHDMEMWVATNIIGNASNVVTVTYSGSAAFRVIIVAQYAGLMSPTPYDVESSGKLDASATTTHTTNSLTTTYADEVVIGFYVCWSTPYVLSAVSPYTIRANDANNDALADRIVSSIGSYSITISSATANQFAMFTKSFKASIASITDVIGGYNGTPINDPTYDESILKFRRMY